MRLRTRTFGRRVLGAVLCTLTALAPVMPTGAAAQEGSVPFGVMFDRSDTSTAAVAVDLGARYVRRVTFVDRQTACNGCVVYQEAGLEIILTARNGGDALNPSAPPADLAAYQARLGTILDASKPAVLVVENEQAADNFYTGTPTEYGQQLAAACEVSHARNIPCADGGLANPLVIAMVYFHYLDSGRPEEADSYARRAATPWEYDQLTNPETQEAARELAREGWEFVSTYRPAGADYINFHWYREDRSAFEETVSVLEQVAGLPAISNEIGQYNEDPQQINRIMTAVSDLDMDYAVWFSIDMDSPRNDKDTRALQNPDGSLRPHGEEYRSFIATRLGTGRSWARITVSSTPTLSGWATTVAGELFGDAACLSLREVELQFAGDLSGEFNAVAATTTDDAGRFTFQRNFIRPGKVRVVAPPAGSCAEGQSDARLVPSGL